MKNIDVIIPTRNRLEKLGRCLKSIPWEAEGIPITVIVVSDGDPETVRAMIEHERVDRILFIKQHSGSVYCRNLVTQTVEGALIYGVDDIEFLPGSIELVVRKMKEIFPDGDGAIGFNYVNGPHQSKTATCLIGQKFLRRHPQRKLFFPKYYHFSCQEIERLAIKYGKLHFEEDAKVYHHSPIRTEGNMDKTHEEGRQMRKQDKAISTERKAKGIIWGDSND